MDAIPERETGIENARATLSTWGSGIGSRPDAQGDVERATRPRRLLLVCRFRVKTRPKQRFRAKNAFCETKPPQS